MPGDGSSVGQAAEKRAGIGATASPSFFSPRGGGRLVWTLVINALILIVPVVVYYVTVVQAQREDAGERAFRALAEMQTAVGNTVDRAKHYGLIPPLPPRYPEDDARKAFSPEYLESLGSGVEDQEQGVVKQLAEWFPYLAAYDRNGADSFSPEVVAEALCRSWQDARRLTSGENPPANDPKTACDIYLHRPRVPGKTSEIALKELRGHLEPPRDPGDPSDCRADPDCWLESFPDFVKRFEKLALVETDKTDPAVLKFEAVERSHKVETAGSAGTIKTVETVEWKDRTPARDRSPSCNAQCWFNLFTWTALAQVEAPGDSDGRKFERAVAAAFLPDHRDRARVLEALREWQPYLDAWGESPSPRFTPESVAEGLCMLIRAAQPEDRLPERITTSPDPVVGLCDIYLERGADREALHALISSLPTDQPTILRQEAPISLLYRFRGWPKDANYAWHEPAAEFVTNYDAAIKDQGRFCDLPCWLALFGELAAEIPGDSGEETAANESPDADAEFPVEAAEKALKQGFRTAETANASLQTWLPYLPAYVRSTDDRFFPEALALVLCGDIRDEGKLAGPTHAGLRAACDDFSSGKQDRHALVKLLAALPMPTAAQEPDALKLLRGFVGAQTVPSVPAGQPGSNQSAGSSAPSGFLAGYDHIVAQQTPDCGMDCWIELLAWTMAATPNSQALLDRGRSERAERDPVEQGPTVFTQPGRLFNLDLCRNKGEGLVASALRQAKGSEHGHIAVLLTQGGNYKPQLGVMSARCGEQGPSVNWVVDVILSAGATRDIARIEAKSAALRIPAAALRIPANNHSNSAAAAAGPLPHLVKQFELWKPLAPYQHLREFDQVLVTDDRGQVLASEGDWRLPPGAPWSMQDQIPDLPVHADASELLKFAALDGWMQRKDPLSAGTDGRAFPPDLARSVVEALGAAPGRPVELNHRLGMSSYRIYLLPYRPGIPVYRAKAAGDQKDGAKEAGDKDGVEKNGVEEVSAFYFIGLKKTGLLALPEGSIGAAEVGLMLAVGLGLLLLMPLLRLFLLEPQDSLGPLQVRLMLLGLLLFVAVLTALVMAVSAQQSLMQALERGARSYAMALEKEIDAQLDEALQIIETQGEALVRGRFSEVPLRYREVGGEVEPAPTLEAIRGGFCTESDEANFYRIRADAATVKPVLMHWSPVDSVIRIDQTGRMGQAVLTPFGCHAPVPRSDLTSRHYVQALRERQSATDQHRGPWTWGDDDAARDFSAERLYSRGRGNKGLQVSLPDGAGGLLSGDASMFPLSAPVLPGHYAFVVFDLAGGTVVFHSDDERSLVENFYSESEQHPRLAAAIGAGKAELFYGDYRGAPNLIHYRPLPGTAWGLAVLHPQEPVQLAVYLAGVMAVAGFFGVALLAVLIVVLVLRLARQINIWCWPQWRLRRAYPRAALVLAGYAMFCALALERSTPYTLPWMLISMSAFMPAVGAALLSVRGGAVRHGVWLHIGMAVAMMSLVLTTTLSASVRPDGDLAIWENCRYLLALMIALTLLLMPSQLWRTWSELRNWLARRLDREIGQDERGADCSLWFPGDLSIGLVVTALSLLALCILCALAVRLDPCLDVLELTGSVCNERFPAGPMTWGLIAGLMFLLMGGLSWAWHREHARSRNQRPSTPWAQEPYFLRAVRSDAAGNLELPLERVRYIRWYVRCVVLGLVVLAVLPTAALYRHALDWQVDALTRADLVRTYDTLVARYWSVEKDLRARVPHPRIRREQFPDAWTLSTALPAPGVRLLPPARVRPDAAGSETTAADGQAEVPVRGIDVLVGCNEGENEGEQTPTACVGDFPPDSMRVALDEGQARWTQSLDSARPQWLTWLAERVAGESMPQSLKHLGAVWHRERLEDPTLGVPADVLVYRPDAPLPDGMRVTLAALRLVPSGWAGIVPESLGKHQWPWWLVALAQQFVLLFSLFALALVVSRRLAGLGMLGVGEESFRYPTFAANGRSAEPETDKKPGTEFSRLMEALSFLKQPACLGHLPRMLYLDFDEPEGDSKAKASGTERNADLKNGIITWLALRIRASEQIGRDRAIAEGLRTRMVGSVAMPEFAYIDLSQEWPMDLSELQASEGIVWMGHFDLAVGLPRDKRKALLGMLERLISSPRLRLVLSCDFAPERQLTSPSEYPQDDRVEMEPDELRRWIAMFGQLRVYALMSEVRTLARLTDRSFDFDGEPETDNGDVIRRKIERECQMLWPRLDGLREELTRDFKAGRVRSAREVEDRVVLQAQGVFHRYWTASNVAERLLLYQLASGRYVNPLGNDALARLVRRGVVSLEPRPRVLSNAFARFVRSAERPQQFAEWAQEASSGTWQRIRTPLVLLALLLLTWFAYSAGAMFQALTAAVATAVGFAGQLGSAFGIMRGGGRGS